VQLVASILMPVTFVTMVAIERAYPGRPLPPIRGWLAKGVIWFAIACAGYICVPTWVAGWVAGGSRSPFHLNHAGLGGLAGFVVADAISHVLHRTLHQVGPLWRWTQQLHHSAERIDVATSTYRHPFDLAVQLGALALAVFLLDLSPDAAALAAYLTLAARMFMHLNVRTPQWLGWIIQRPEAHAVHHARGVHAYNYGTLPLWDIALGTFRNPARFSSEPAGYWDGASREVKQMLVGTDVGERNPGHPGHPEHPEHPGHRSEGAKS
jgi:sterol desaturase/sphingolipid hydroxylase (fatty acid hydroxylase superfamily)